MENPKDMINSYSQTPLQTKIARSIASTCNHSIIISFIAIGSFKIMMHLSIKQTSYEASMSVHWVASPWFHVCQLHLCRMWCANNDSRAPFKPKAPSFTVVICIVVKFDVAPSSEVMGPVMPFVCCCIAWVRRLLVHVDGFSSVRERIYPSFADDPTLCNHLPSLSNHIGVNWEVNIVDCLHFIRVGSGFFR